MQNKSAHQLAKTISRSILIKNLIIISVFTFPMILAINITSKLNESRNVIKGINSEISEMVLMGNVFQMKRQIQSLLDSKTFDGIWIFENHYKGIVADGTNIPSVNFEMVKNHSFLILSSSFYLVQKQYLSTAHAGNIGTIVTLKKVSLSFFALTFMVLLISILFLFIILRSNFEKLSGLLVDPILNFKNQILSYKVNQPAVIRNNLMYQELLETASDFEELLSKLNAEKIKSNEFERRKAIFETSKIFLHDIQSPITAISSVLSIFPSNNENFSLINLALKRLKEIVEKQKQIEFYNKDFDVNVCPIFECIESVFKEKKMEYHSKGVEFKLNKNISDEVFSKVDYSMFKRIISNILNNAIEALDKDFKLIEVFVDKIDKLIVIKITDNGKGISGEIINKVMSKDFTFGKKNGSGIGLYYAQTNLKSWNGNISISSKINSGTCVTVTLLEEPEVEIQGVK